MKAGWYECPQCDYRIFTNVFTPYCKKCKNSPRLILEKNIYSFSVRERPAGSDTPTHFVIIAHGEHGCGRYTLPFEIENYETANALAKAMSDQIDDKGE